MTEFSLEIRIEFSDGEEERKHLIMKHPNPNDFLHRLIALCMAENCTTAEPDAPQTPERYQIYDPDTRQLYPGPH